MTRYFRCATAWLDGRVVPDVVVGCDDGIITSLSSGDRAGPDPNGQRGPEVDGRPEWLPGLVLPAFADAHSHLFHRALRGRTHGSAEPGSFWTWREQMYRLADRLNPDSFRRLALAVYVEMVCAGVSAVGEFHYLHHGPGGVPYAQPNLLGTAAVEAGAEVGLAVTLLDTAYLAGGFGVGLNPTQLRFSDGSVEAWASRVAALPPWIRHGVAIHSVRAVPVAALPLVARTAAGRVLHVHLSEQPAENAAALSATGRTPTALLADAGALSSLTSAVHATHLTAADVDLLGAAGVSAVVCPTTEADLADGLPQARPMADAGMPLALGSDQHVAIDPLAQLRGLEYGERLRTGVRGNFTPAELLRAATVASHRSIGSPAGELTVGAPADFVALDTTTARTAGSEGLQVVLAASAADVAVVVVGGEVQARGGVHVRFGAPGPLLAQAIAAAWS